MIEIHQWQLLLIHFGDYLDLFETEKNYKKENFSNGINLGREFSEPHMAIVLSPTPLCKGDTILVVPITNYTLNDEKHWDKIVLDNYNFLHKRVLYIYRLLETFQKSVLLKKLDLIFQKVFKKT